MENVWLALIVAIPAMLSPVIMSWLTNRQMRLGKAEDYARQDAVAAKVDAAAAKAAEAAKLLLAANERVAATTVITNGKLDVIHTLVNSSLTTAVQDSLDARRISLALMLEIVELKKVAGKQPTRESLAAISSVKAKIAELETLLADRLRAQDAIEKTLSTEMTFEGTLRPQT